MAIINRISNQFNRIASCNLIKKQLDQGLKDPASFAAKMLVVSLVSKDAVNCIIYTAQSAYNKEIPDDKRPFVAALDAFNGILNVVGQIAAFTFVDKVLIPKWFGENYSGTFKDNITKKVTDLNEKFGAGSADKSRLLDDNIRGIVNDVVSGNTDNVLNKGLVKKIKDIIEKNGIQLDKYKNSTAEVDGVAKRLIKELGKDSSKFKAVEKGFALLVGALATTALVKRTLVPLIATPLAGMYSDYYEKRHHSASRVDYQWAALASDKYDNKMDKTAFSNISSKRSV